MIDILLLFLLSLCILLLLYVLSTMCRRGHKGLSELRGWSYAHRGLHGADAPENSLCAFKKAVDAGYGIELDVHLLADGDLAIIHDSQLFRTTGMEGCVEDLTAEQLRNCYLEGTECVIPLFRDALRIVDSRVPLIVELKPNVSNYAPLCKSVCDLLDSYNGVFCLESFDPRCVFWLRRNRPDLIRGQLVQNYFSKAHSKLPWIVKWFLRNQAFNFLTKPDFVAYRYSDRITVSNRIVKNLWKAPLVSWTLKNQEEYDIAVNEGWIPIFEGFLP